MNSADNNNTKRRLNLIKGLTLNTSTSIENIVGRELF